VLPAEPAPVPQAPSHEKTPAYVPPPLRPWLREPAPSTACFTFRTMDHLKSYVIINGERVTETSCLWAYSLAYEFDPKIPVTDWPPKTAGFAGAASTKDERGRIASTIEIAVEGGLYDLAGRDRLKKAYPHLESGEQVLYVNAEIFGQIHRGALRLKLVGEDGTNYRYTNFTPIQSMEEENASLFARSVWFQRERSD
jgi:hypothetical protein